MPYVRSPRATLYFRIPQQESAPDSTADRLTQLEGAGNSAAIRRLRRNPSNPGNPVNQGNPSNPDAPGDPRLIAALAGQEQHARCDGKRHRGTGVHSHRRAGRSQHIA